MEQAGYRLSLDRSIFTTRWRQSASLRYYTKQRVCFFKYSSLTQFIDNLHSKRKSKARIINKGLKHPDFIEREAVPPIYVINFQIVSCRGLVLVSFCALLYTSFLED